MITSAINSAINPSVDSTGGASAGSSGASTDRPAGRARRSVRSLLFEGARDVTPMVVGVVPFALAIGASIGSSSLTKAQGIVSAPTILAGSAQLAAVDMLGSGAAPIVIVATALIVNARILLYSAALAPWFADQRLSARLLLAIPIIEQLYFTVAPRFERRDLDERGRIAYYAGAAAFLAGAWAVAQAGAILLGARAPDGLGLHAAAPLALVGLLARSTSDRRAVGAATVGAVVAVVAVGLPVNLSLLAGALAGILAGTSLPEGRHDGEGAAR